MHRDNFSCVTRRFDVGRDSSVGIATRQGLDGLGIESRLGARYAAPAQTGPVAHPSSYTMGTGSFPGVKRPGSGVDHPLPSSTEFKERAELYLTPLLGLRGLFYRELYLFHTSICYSSWYQRDRCGLHRADGKGFP
jgi:hypothetical protein